MNRRSRKGRRGRSGCYRRRRKESTRMPEREPFDWLGNDPRHVRGDVRKVYTAVRRRRLDGNLAAQDALCRKLFDDRILREDGEALAHVSEVRRIGTFLVIANTAVEMVRQNRTDEWHAIHKSIAPDRRAEGEPGRPWKRWRLADVRARALDARDNQSSLSELAAAGRWWVQVGIGEGTDRRWIAVDLARIGRGFAASMIVYVCPDCRRKTRTLYPCRCGCSGNWCCCRRCAGLRYQ